MQEMMPTTRKRWRKAEDGSGELEECECAVRSRRDNAKPLLVDWDLAFPDDEREANPASYNFFKAAQEWAAQRNAGGGLSYDMPDSDSDDDDDDDDAEPGEGAGEAEAMDQDD